MDNSKIKVSCVSYLNSKPFLYGLENHKLFNDITIHLDHPSDCANKLKRKEVDIGLIPVAAIENIEKHAIISDYCIGSNGPVDSVLLISNVPLQEIEAIELDYQSVTSVKLIRILCDKFWNIAPAFKASVPGFENKISDNTGAVVIGDKAIRAKGMYKYVYDLSEAWLAFSGLPFVFACWVSNRTLNEQFVDDFNDALGFGIDHIDQVVSEAERSGKYLFDVKNYLNIKLKYELTDELRKGMNYFLQLSKEYDTAVIDR